MKRKFYINYDKENIVQVKEFPGTSVHSLESCYKGDLYWGGIGVFWKDYYFGVFRYTVDSELYKDLIGIHLAITRDNWRNEIFVVGITISDKLLARGTFTARWSMRSNA